MINVKALILSELEKLNYPVSFFYPSDWSTLPSISYYEASNIEYLRTDGEEQLSEISIQIDIWSANPSKNSEIALEVDKTMSSLGFIREFSGDLFDEGIHHKSMRYRAIVDKDKNNVYQ